MNETGWQAIGRVAKERRERLRLNQDELSLYGGPKVATVGKFERAAQANFPLRTQHQMENSLGWRRGTIEEFVAAWDEGDVADMDAWEHDLVNEDIPDLSQPSVGADDLATEMETLNYILRVMEPSVRAEAMKVAISAMVAFLHPSRGTSLGTDLRLAHSAQGGDGDDGSDRAAPIGADKDPLSEVDDTLPAAAKEQGLQEPGEDSI